MKARISPERLNRVHQNIFEKLSGIRGKAAY